MLARERRDHFEYKVELIKSHLTQYHESNQKRERESDRERERENAKVNELFTKISEEPDSISTQQNWWNLTA